MVSEVVWEPAVKIAESLVNWPPPETLIGFFAFASSVEGKVDFTQDRKTLGDELMNLQRGNWKERPKGQPRKTALLDALMMAIDSMSPPRLGDTIFLITDGDDNASRVHQSPVEKRLVSTGIRLFCFLLYNPVTAQGRRIADEIDRQRLLRPLVEAAGGGLVVERIEPDFPMTKYQHARILDATTAFVEEATEFYRLELKLPTRVDKPRDLKVDAVRAASGRASHLEVTYPKQLVPCK